jgi:DinB superfamily
MSEIADLLERFRRGPELLAVATTGAAGPELDFKSEGKWSVRQIVCHLADTEAVGVMRFRQLLAEENPSLAAWDQEAWASRLDYDKRKISQALEIFRVLRFSNYELLKELPGEAYARAGVHTKRGPMSLLDVLRIYANHVESHVKQLHAARAAYKEHRAKVASS